MNLKLLKQIGSISAFLLLLALPAKADGTIGIGIIGNMSSFDTTGTETEGDGIDASINSDFETTTASKSEDVEYAHIFAELILKGNHIGLTWGAEHVPGTHNIGKQSRTDTAAASGAGQQATQSYTAEAVVSNMVATYLEPTIYINDAIGIYGKVGVTRVMVETLETGDHTSTYGSEGIFGTTHGAGIRLTTPWGIYLKLEHVETDYEDVAFKSDTGNRNSISANIDEKSDRIAIGYQF